MIRNLKLSLQIGAVFIGTVVGAVARRVWVAPLVLVVARFVKRTS